MSIAALALFALLGGSPMTPPAWSEPQPGVWRAGLGRTDHPTLIEAAGAKPLADRIRRLPVGPLPFELKRVEGVRAGDFTTVRIPLQAGEKIFGLGLQMSGSNRRGGVYHLRVDHYASGHDRLHAPTPLYISSLGYAVFLDTCRPINVYVGVGNRVDDPNIPRFRDRNTDPKWDAQPDSGWVEVSVQGPGLRVFVFAGPTPMAALQRCNLFCGGGALPPEWALGFWHRTRSLATAHEVEAEAAEFSRRGFPLDVIGLEPGWESRAYPGTMEWSPERFPDPAAFVRGLAVNHVHVNLWENPYVAPGSNLARAIDGGIGSHTVWLGEVPDVLDPKVAQAEADFHAAKHLAIGVSGYKIDEVDGFDEWLWPDHALFPSGLDGLRMRQIYGVLWQRLLTEMFRRHGERTFGLVRGSNGGAVRFPFAIYSDTYDHRQYVTALTSSSLAGVIWCAEIRSANSDEEWVRRMQSACLSPIAQLNAWDSGKKPWSYPAVDGPVRDAMTLREALVPYLYTAFAQYRFDGIPPIRPMCLVDGGEETDQYMLGSDLLVAPMLVGDTTRKVRLPKGGWCDYFTGAKVGSDETITVSPALDRIPLFVREGAAIPTAPGQLHVDPSAPIVLRCYGAGPWTGSLYEDDGVGFGFEKGDFGLFVIRAGERHITASHVDGGRPRPSVGVTAQRIQ